MTRHTRGCKVSHKKRVELIQVKRAVERELRQLERVQTVLQRLLPKDYWTVGERNWLREKAGIK